LDETGDIISSYDSESSETRFLRFDERSISSEPRPSPKIQPLVPVSLDLSSTISGAETPTELVSFSQPLDPQSSDQSIPSHDHPLSIEELIDTYTWSPGI
jgi:hypothetical protein